MEWKKNFTQFKYVEKSTGILRDLYTILQYIYRAYIDAISKISAHNKLFLIYFTRVYNPFVYL